MGPPLRNFTVLPLLLTPEHDESLWKLTEGRIGVFSHDMVPDYLRTKPDPAAEQRMLQHEQKANALNVDAAAKQVAQYAKVVAHVFDMVSKAREEWEVEASARTGVQQTSSLADTQALVAAVGMGKGLKGQTMGGGAGGPGGPGAVGTGSSGAGGVAVGLGIGGGGGAGGAAVAGGGGIGGMSGAGAGIGGAAGMGGMGAGNAGGSAGVAGAGMGGGGGGIGMGGGGGGGPMGAGGGGMMVPPAMRAQTPLSAVSPGQAGGNAMNKVPSAIKTNIKSANAIHPYGR